MRNRAVSMTMPNGVISLPPLSESSIGRAPMATSAIALHGYRSGAPAVGASVAG
jgi:hypothetical protein